MLSLYQNLIVYLLSSTSVLIGPVPDYLPFSLCTQEMRSVLCLQGS